MRRSVRDPMVVVVVGPPVIDWGCEEKRRRGRGRERGDSDSTRPPPPPLARAVADDNDDDDDDNMACLKSSRIRRIN
jgi:hypothetical protein